MQAYIARRLIVVPFMLFGMSLLLFWLLFLRPGNAALTGFGLVSPDQNAKAIASLEEEFGLDRPFFVQYGNWAWGAIRGDFGISLKNRRPVTPEIRSRLPVTAELGLLTVLLTAVIGIPVGIISAIRPGTFLDGFLRIMTISGISVPNFWVATLVITLPAIWWAWTPLWEYVRLEDDPLNNLKIVIWPAVTLAIATAAYVARIVRSSMLETLYSDYVRTARAKGLRERAVVLRHVFRSSMIAVITVIGIQLGAVLGGSVIAEQIFGIPGLGLLVFESVVSIDYTVALAAIMVFAFMFTIVNLAVDLTYTFIDPRIRY